MTSSKETPQVEFLDRKNEKTEIRLLSAITKVPKNKLAEIVESTLEGKLREAGITIKKESMEHGNEQKHDNESEKGQMSRINIYRKNEWK